MLDFARRFPDARSWSVRILSGNDGAANGSAADDPATTNRQCDAGCHRNPRPRKELLHWWAPSSGASIAAVLYQMKK